MTKFIIKFPAIFMMVIISACQMNRQEPAPVIGYDTPVRPITRSSPSIKCPDFIIVKPGDSLSIIARHYQIPAQQIITLNNLKPPYNLLIQQKLLLKRQLSVKHMPTTKVPAAASVSVPSKKSLEKAIINQPIVLTGNTSKAAVKHNANASDKKPYMLIPPSSRSTVNQSNSVKMLPPEIIIQPSTEPTDKQAEIITIDDTALIQSKIDKPVQNIGNYHPKFLWPLKGKILTKFGAMDTGFQNDGVNIEASEGAPIHAVDNGIVAYVGNELQGFGNLIMIKHQSGWMSAYAHCSEFLVARGDKVKRGDKIALVGHTGNVRTSQLHFELRKKTKAVDPLTYLE